MFDTLCRFCGKKTVKKFSCIFDEESDENGRTLLQKISSCIPITINEADHLPKRLCANCLDETNNVHNFIQTVLETQKTFTDDDDDDKTIKTECVEDESTNGRRQTRASTKRTHCEQPDCDPFECVTITENLGKSSYRERTTELEIDLIPTETKKVGDKRLNDDVSNALKKLKTVARNLTVSRTTTKTASVNPVAVPKALHRSRAHKESTSDNDNDKDDPEFDGDFGDADESKSISSFSSQSDDDDDEDDYVPQKKKQSKVASNTTKATTSAQHSTSKKDENFTVYKINSPPVFLCLKCDTRFAAFAELKSHINGDNECKRASLTCEICNKLCKNRKSLHGHVKGHEQKSSFVCDQCGKVYTNQFNLENHKSAQHGEYVQEHGHTYRCQMCEARFDNRTDLYAHIANHEKTPVTVVCDKCGKSFNSNKALHTHLRQHLDIRPYACTYCPKRFGKRLTLTQHLHVHTGIKTFKCDQCEKSFAKRDSLVIHKRKHTGEMPYQCNYCSQKYRNLNQLKTHLKSHPVNDYDDDDGRDGDDIS